ncbi:tripartite tricarboxylate transporter TctB family protein [Nocardiopsis sediminis]|uniref:Tripartite tricarboxylate transporter TctB family protein n=1 Tax=Nocardiopsis sediminis TaxID=1778267 RepID=A0ABV8FQS7_9ACTN
MATPNATGAGAAPAPGTAPSRLRELAPAAAGAGLAAAALLLTGQIDQGPETAGMIGPRWWPETLAFTLLGLSALHAALAWRRPAPGDAPDPATREGVLRLVAMAAAIVGYGVLWYFIHFLVSTTVLVAALTYLGGGRGWRALLAFPVVTTVVLYVLFGVVLRVPL